MDIPEPIKDSNTPEQRPARLPVGSPSDFEPIAGVDLATYAWIVKQIAPLGYDQALLPGIAARRGVGADDWAAAMEGWASRMSNPAVATTFRAHYDEA